VEAHVSPEGPAQIARLNHFVVKFLRCCQRVKFALRNWKTDQARRRALVFKSSSRRIAPMASRLTYKAF
jgi:hypothetical protein